MAEDGGKSERRLANLKPFPKGVSGNPGGRPKSRILSDAYRRRLDEVDPSDAEGRTFAEVIAARVVEAAAGGDMQAARELADRTEGKARQTVTLTFDQREKLEAAIAGIMEESGCGREEAVRTLSMFRPEASALLN